MAQSYGTVQGYRASTLKTDTGDDLDIARDLGAVSDLMDRRLGIVRTSELTDWLIVPQYGTDGLAPKILNLPPVASAEGLVVKIDTDRDGDFSDETALPESDYRLLPLNAATSSLPYSQLEARGNQYRWPVGQDVQVTALFGLPAELAILATICIRLTAVWRLEWPQESLDTLMSTNGEAKGLIEEMLNALHPTGGVVVG